MVIGMTDADAGESTGSSTGRAFGIDIGGTGIKGAIVDTKSGKLLTKRTRILTPRPDGRLRISTSTVSNAGSTATT